MFTKRTIRPERVVTSVDTPSEALAVSIGEHGKVDLPYMAELLGTPGNYERITTELSGVIFKDPAADADDPEAGWQTADEYLSGNVRDKLRMAQLAAESHPEFKVNVDALTKAQPKDLEASEIDVRLGATWLAPSIVQQFMMETFQPPYRIRYNNAITVRYSPYTSEWRISNKSATGFGDIMATETYGTRRANAYKILEDTLNLRDSRVYDTIEEDGKEKRVLNQNETTLAQQKQQAIKDAFAGWVWKDPQRRALLVKKYNELFNSTRPREYDGSHIHFVGMNPEINLREHQRNAVAHVLYGCNTLLAHEVGAGKSFEIKGMVYDDKKAAGERLLLARQEMPNADMMLLGTYRGFELNIRFDSFKNEHQAVLRAELSYPVSLGDDARGNITRLDNAIDNFADRIADAENALQNLEQQKQAAEVEVAKPFAQEEELAEKSARLAELNALLNIDRDRSSSQDAPEETEETETPATRPSVLAALGEKTNQPEPVKPFRSYYDKDGDAR